MELRNKKANESNRLDILMEIRASEERMERKTKIVIEALMI
jgi:hypothetical protein